MAISKGVSLWSISVLVYAIGLTTLAYYEQAVWGIWKPYTGFYWDYFSNWLDVIFLVDAFFVAFMPDAHEYIKLVHPTFGGFSCLMYWGVIATDPSRLRLNLVSFHQHCIRYVLTIIQLFIDREPIGLKQILPMILFGYGYIVRVYYVSTLGRTTIYPFIDFEKDPYTPFKFMFIYGTAWGAVNWMVFKFLLRQYQQKNKSQKLK